MNLINFLKRRKITLDAYVKNSFPGKDLTEVVTELATLGFEVDEELSQSLEALLSPPETSVVDSEAVDVSEPVEPAEETEKPVKRNKRSKEQQG